MQKPKKSVAKAISGGVKSSDKNTINVPVKPSDIVKPGYGENGRKLRKNYMKEQREMASVSTLYKKKK